jgi:hypothetical protein
VGLRGSPAGRIFGVARGVRDRDGATAAIPFSCSESASSCLMMAAFSDFCAFLGSLANVFSTIANTTKAVTIPTQTMLVIDACFLASVV